MRVLRRCVAGACFEELCCRCVFCGGVLLVRVLRSCVAGACFEEVCCRSVF